MVLQAKAAKENSVAVTLTEVAFEGNFVSVHGVTEGGKDMVAELRNDGSTPIPSAGAQMHMVFDARNAAILPDSATAGA
jgi:spermidine/putrescine transport system ATP-binding protein